MRVFEARDDDEEAMFVASEVQRLVKTGRVGSYADVGVMYRANSQGRSVEGAMVSMGVPHKMLRARGWTQDARAADPDTNPHTNAALHE